MTEDDILAQANQERQKWVEKARRLKALANDPTGNLNERENAGRRFMELMGNRRLYAGEIEGTMTVRYVQNFVVSAPPAEDEPSRPRPKPKSFVQAHTEMANLMALTMFALTVSLGFLGLLQVCCELAK